MSLHALVRRAVPIALVLAAILSASEVHAQEGAQPDGEPAVATYPVAARDLARGEILALVDIARVERPAAENAKTPQDVVGWRTRRVISEGEPLLPPAVSPPDLIKAGDTVHAVWRGGTIVVRIAGTAAGSAAMGERVLVRVDARRRLEGVVIGPSLVEIESLDRGR